MAALVASAVAAASDQPDIIDAPVPPQKPFEIVVPKPSSPHEFEKFPAEDEAEVEEEDIEPAYYYEDMGIPVFTPTMDQFRSFSKFVNKINHYGMKSGIVKVIPPKEWTDALPPLDEKVKDVKIKNPIEQHIAGISGEYRQTNVERQRTYNLPQWRHVCEGSDHQPPARRGERRRGQPAPVPVKRNTRSRRSAAKDAVDEDMDDVPIGKTNPPTPESPADKVEDGSPEPVKGRQPREKARTEETPETDAHGRQPKKKAPRKTKTAKKRAEDRELADEVAYEGFEYRMLDADQYTPERCGELEKAYWRTLTYNNPLYGADMPGSLFDDSTTSWNVANLENLLDCLGKKLPGVNTAYLYLGMWKSTFAWHLEDMDLYSINYIHFGAPKQWYSISRDDKAKFEQVMKTIWPNEYKKCSQFLRHKTFLVSPSLLAHHGIKVNRLVHHQGEFVITFPFGYHSGYNLGYNCAESVNFATPSWLNFGRDAKKCDCVDDSVFVDIDEIERKLRGEPTEDEDEEDEDGYPYYYEGRHGDFPTPPESVDGGKSKAGRPRKRKAEEAGDGRKLKKFKRPPRNMLREPCVLCPNDIPSEPLLHTENGDKAHRLCVIYTPETYFKWDHAANREIVANIDEIPKARLELKCIFCRQKKGSCFQCSAKKCTRAYHATCAAAAGVLVNMVDVQVTGEDGEKYAQTSIDYRCKMHRPKRPKDCSVETLEEDPLIRKFSTALIKDDVIQMQYLHGEIFAGVVIENRKTEETVLVQILPRGDIVEVEWKWILAQDPSETNFPDAITTAPLYPDPNYRPARRAKVAHKDIPEPDQPFGDAGSSFKWGELVVGDEALLQARDQAPISQWWYYLGELSTEYIPKYSEDPARRVHNPAATFVAAKPPRQQKPYRPASQNIKQEPGVNRYHHPMPMMHLNPQSAADHHYHQQLLQQQQHDYAMRHNMQQVGYRQAPYNPPMIRYPVQQQQQHPPVNGGHYAMPSNPALDDRRLPLSVPLQHMFGERAGQPPQHQYAGQSPQLHHPQQYQPPMQQFHSHQPPVSSGLQQFHHHQQQQPHLYQQPHPQQPHPQQPHPQHPQQPHPQQQPHQSHPQQHPLPHPQSQQQHPQHPQQQLPQPLPQQHPQQHPQQLHHQPQPPIYPTYHHHHHPHHTPPPPPPQSSLLPPLDMSKSTFPKFLPDAPPPTADRPPVKTITAALAEIARKHAEQQQQQQQQKHEDVVEAGELMES